ncbi:MFS transporter [Alsobacter soli]|uniref:MFS transporter n=1 Tax=Alsobacter soli TaxID=2109933 RepID=A0A2T1HWK7_9HYPH|nr:MFS transporter [Alsobacter soli]PSC06062.1 MFS transporter [Alsobacter soli]
MSHTVASSLSRVTLAQLSGAATTAVVAVMAFLTLVDLFAAQAILPALTRAYGATPAAMGVAVNASTLGMAVAALAVALFGSGVDRRTGIVGSLALLACPTALLAFAPSLAVFTGLRVAQGLCMATAFTLTLAYLGERCRTGAAAGAFAAYITGNVASNLFGRLLSATVADQYGLAPNFLVFAGLNLAGAALAAATLSMYPPSRSTAPARPRWTDPWRRAELRAAFGVGFCILFAFIATFTYANFVLVAPPLGLSPVALGFAYLVFAPSIATTPVAGAAVSRFGSRPVIMSSLAVAALGLPLLLASSVAIVLAGLALVGVGTFFAQAAATGFVGRSAGSDRAVASGFYLASYFAGGLAGAAILGRVFDAYGWPACVVGIGGALAAAALLGRRLVSEQLRA